MPVHPVLIERPRFVCDPRQIERKKITASLRPTRLPGSDFAAHVEQLYEADVSCFKWVNNGLRLGGVLAF